MAKHLQRGMAVLLRTEEDAEDESGWHKPWSVALVNRRARRPPCPSCGSPGSSGCSLHGVLGSCGTAPSHAECSRSTTGAHADPLP